MSDDNFSVLEDPDVIYTVMWVVVGVMLLWAGRRTYGLLLSGGLAGVVLTTQLFVTGIGVIVLASVDRVDMRRYSYPVAAWVIYTVAALGVFVYLVMDPGFFASDVSLFESWAAHLLAVGRNPMGESMLVSREAWDIANASANITATTSGGVVGSYSYPGGSLWLSTLEQILLPANRLGIGTLLASIGFMSWLVVRVDRDLVPLALLVFLAPVIRPVSAAMGMITPLWLFPLAVGLAAWYDDRLLTAAVGLGIAVAVKQLAWPIAGLVVVHVLRTRGPRAARRLVAIAGAVGAVLVGWFVVQDPAMWAYSALYPFLPIADPLVAQGVGLTSITVGGVATVPRSLHRVLVIAVAGGLIAATWRYPDRMRWVIPFASVITMLVHYRTLPSYYAAAVPLAVVAIDARVRDAAPSPQLLERALVRFVDRVLPNPEEYGGGLP